MSLKVLFICEKLWTEDGPEATLIAEEAINRGYEIEEIRPHEISFREGVLYGGKHILENFDVIHFRPTPPVDMAYLTNLYLLNTIRDKTLIINNPEAIIKFPEKIFPLEFYEFMPPTIITSSKLQLENFCNDHKEIVVKPLYDFGGNGVARYNNSNISEFSFGDSNIPITAQKFLPSIINGDKRVFLLDGEVDSITLRIPKEGEFRANSVHGSSLMATNLTDKELYICEKLKPHLKSNGILVCGLDLIDGLITEINITSPAGFKFARQLYNTFPEKKLWDIIESRLKK